MTRDEICARILAAPLQPKRRLIAVVGPPGSGKSTFAAQLADDLAHGGQTVQIVPMDGFHLDNRLLDARGLRAQKGAPQTFDAAGVLRLIQALQGAEGVVYPLFDRAHDIAIAGAGYVPPDCDTVLVEGNYLLFDAPIWRDLATRWSLSIALTPPPEVLQARLVQRWLDHGLTAQDAARRANDNDMKNAELVVQHMLPADLTLSETPP